MFRAAPERTLIEAAEFLSRVRLWTGKFRIRSNHSRQTSFREDKFASEEVSASSVPRSYGSVRRSLSGPVGYTGCGFAARLLLGPRLAAVQE